MERKWKELGSAMKENMKPKLIKSNIKLTIGMLVSNHIGTIRNCMESIKPLLDAIPSELVAIDTVGEETDGSIEIVREYTDRIYPFVWCNDFAAARNCCLDHARGEWFLYFDDDEWFDDVQEFIDFFQSGESEHYHSGYYYTRDYSADGSYSMGIAGRMIRRTVNTRFIGKVHESFNEVFAPNKLFSCFTHHYGYAFADEDSKQKHQNRNLSILREELRAEGYTPRICAQMTQELLYMPKTREEGGSFCMESIERLQEAGQLGDALSQWLLLASVRFYFSNGEYEKALWRAREVCSHYKTTQMARLGISWVAACSAANCSNYLEIEEWAIVYLKCYDWLKQHPEESLLQMQLDMPKYCSEQSLFGILQAAIAVANAMGKFEQALGYLKRFPWKEYEAGRAKYFDGSKYQEELLDTLRGLEDKSYLISYYKKIYKPEWFLPENRMYLPKECREALDIQGRKT